MLCPTSQVLAQTYPRKNKKTKYKVTGNLTVSNTGYITAKNVIVNIYISDDTTYDSTDLYLYSKNFGTIKSSKLKTKKIKYTFDADPAGKYLLAVIENYLLYIPATNVYHVAKD